MRVRENIRIPYLSINPSYLATYTRSEFGRESSRAQVDNYINLQYNDTKGEISRKAERNIKKAINWVLYTTKDKKLYPTKRHSKFTFRLAFITLTLSSKQTHSDNYIKKHLLQPFLNSCRQKWNCEHYLWRAEAQKNGNIHFHIVIDKFIYWNEIRNEWNKIQAKMGYMDEYRAKYGYKQANSTDIHSIYKIKNVGAYLAKYCTKQSKNRKIEGKQWGLSYSLSRLKNARTEIDSRISSELEKIWKAFPDKVRVKDYVECVYVGVKDWVQLGCLELKRLLDSYVLEVSLNSS